MKIAVSVTMPDDLVGEFLQLLRDFDVKHDPNHEGKVVLQMLAEGNQTAEQMAAVFDAIRPSMEFKHAIKFDN
jgi:hypothetical protein